MFVDRYLNIIQLALYLYPVVALLLLFPYIFIHKRKAGRVPKRRFLVFSLFVYYLLTAFLLTEMPFPALGDAGEFCAKYRDFARPVWTPFLFAGNLYTTLKAISISALVHNYEFQATFFNFLLLLPLGFFLRYLYRLKAWTVFGLSLSFSLFIELTQYSGFYGMYPCPYRLCQVDDLIVNSAGAMYGFALMPYVKLLPQIFEKPLVMPRGQMVLRRLLAFSLDWGLLALLVRQTMSSIELRTPGRLIGEWAFVLLIFVLVTLLAKGQTPGKMLLRIRMVKKDGSVPGLGSLLLRYALILFMPILFNWIFNHWSSKGVDRFYYRNIQLAINAVWFALILIPIFWRKDRMGLHDLIAGTRHKEAEDIGPTSS